jgi:hypothetical protein
MTLTRQQRIDKVIQCLDFYANCPKAYDKGALARKTLAEVAQAEALDPPRKVRQEKNDLPKS